jgi:hypothetical protein
MYTLDKDGKRVYTLKKVVNGEVTKSAHPARFSPDDRYSRCVAFPFYPVPPISPICVSGVEDQNGDEKEKEKGELENWGSGNG